MLLPVAEQPVVRLAARRLIRCCSPTGCGATGLQFRNRSTSPAPPRPAPRRHTGRRSSDGNGWRSRYRRAIASWPLRAAAELVQAGETIILDSGTTTIEIARHLKILKTQPVTIITNALNIAVELTDVSGISLIMVGGLLRSLSCSFVGPQAEAMMKK